MIGSPYDLLMGVLLILSPLPLIGAGLLFFFGWRAEERRKKVSLYVGGGVLMCWPVLIAARYAYESIANEKEEQRTLAGYERMKETLGTARMVQGVTLPAGTQVVGTSDAIRTSRWLNCRGRRRYSEGSSPNASTVVMAIGAERW